jgi:hypothetical protein
MNPQPPDLIDVAWCQKCQHFWQWGWASETCRNGQPHTYDRLTYKLVKNKPRKT